MHNRLATISLDNVTFVTFSIISLYKKKHFSNKCIIYNYYIFSPNNYRCHLKPKEKVISVE